MIKEFIEKWHENKDKLEDYFRNTNQNEYANYKTILEKIIDLVINEGVGFRNYDIKSIHEIDDGVYQGTLIYLIPRKTCQPDCEDYIWTAVDYGSCSVCDTLQGIQDAVYPYEGKPTTEQVKEYMALSLHMVERMNRLFSRGEG